MLIDEAVNIAKNDTDYFSEASSQHLQTLQNSCWPHSILQQQSYGAPFIHSLHASILFIVSSLNIYSYVEKLHYMDCI